MNPIPSMFPHHISEVKVKGLYPLRLYKLKGILNRNNVSGFCFVDVSLDSGAYFTTYCFTGYDINAHYVGPVIPPNSCLVHIVDNVYCMCTIPVSVRSVHPTKKKGIVSGLRKFWNWFNRVMA